MVKTFEKYESERDTSFEEYEQKMFRTSPTAVLDPNEDKKIKQTLDMADVNEVGIDIAEKGLNDFVAIKKKKETFTASVGPMWDIGTDKRTFRERFFGYPPPEKLYKINFGATLFEIPKGITRFLERDVGGTFGGTVYNWLGQFIEQGGHAVNMISKLGDKDKDRMYNPYAESIIATGQGISAHGKQAREWFAYQAATGWEAMDKDLRERDPIAYGAGRLTEGVASSALSVLAMYLSGGAAAPAVLSKGYQINRGLAVLSTMSAAGAFEHAQNQKENFYWATVHGLADGATEYVMESTFLEGVGKGTSKLLVGAKEGAEEFATGMLQNTRAGILENEAKGMSAYDASKKAMKDALIQSPWEVAAGFIGGFGIAGGSNLVQLMKRSEQLPSAEQVREKIIQDYIAKAEKEGLRKPPTEAKLAPRKPVAPITKPEAVEVRRPIEMTRDEFIKAHKGQFSHYEGKRRLVVLSSDKVEFWTVPKESQRYGKLTKSADEVLGDIYDRHIAPQQGKPSFMEQLQKDLAKPEAVEVPPEAKQPWEMTKSEFIKHQADFLRKRLKTVSPKTIEAPALINEIAKLDEGEFTPTAQEVRRDYIQRAIEQGKPVPRKFLEEYKSEKWAQEALAKPPAKAEANVIDFAKETGKARPIGIKGIVPEKPGFKTGDIIYLKNNKEYGPVKVEAIELTKADPITGLEAEYLIKTRDESGKEVWGRANQFEPPAKAEAAKVEKPEVEPIAKEARDILGGVDPINQIHIALKSAKAVQPLTKKQKKAELRQRVGKAAGALKTNVKKGIPTEEAVFKSTGLLKGPLAEYDQVYTSVEDILEPGAKEAAYQKIYNHPELRYFETLNTTTSFKKLLAGAALTPGDVENIERVFGKTFEDITTERQTKSDLYDRVITIWKAGLLTGIKTQALNITSNTAHAMSETAKDIPAAFVDSITSLFTGKRTLAFTARGLPGGIKTGFERGWKYLKTGIDVRNVGIKLDYKKVYFGDSKIAKGLQAYEEFIFHLLGAADQPFYYGAKAKSLYSQAIAQAKNKGLKGAARQAYVNKVVQNPTDEMLEYSVHDAEIAVYQNRTKLGDVAKAIQKVKGGEVVVPFGRTPSAVATQILNYSPIGYVKAVAESINEGVFDQRKFSQAFGRATVGTGALYIGTLLFTKGLIALDYPDNERERELWKAEGRKANSIKIGDKWRDIQVLGPVGNVLVIGGHFQNELNETGSPTQAMIQAMSGGAKSFTEQTFVRGVNLTVDAITDPERSFERWFTSMSGSVVPTIVADTARAMDEQERRTKGPIERIQSRIPILREGLPPKIDVFGQDLPRYGGNVLETMIDPTRPSKIRQDIVVDELRRLWDKDMKVSPTLLGDKDGYDILSKEENTQLWRRSGELSYKILLGLVTSERYEQLDDFGKGKMVEMVTKQAKESAKAEIVNIKLSQGVSIMKLAESGLLTIDSLEMLKYYSIERTD